MKKLNFSFFLKSLVLGLFLTIFTSCNQETKETKSIDDSASKFKGKIALDIRDSESDWSAFTPKSAPEGAPNILFILYDDTGLGA